MEQIENITLIGTSHISKQSVDEITNFINNKNPEIVAVELDRDRLSHLFSKKNEKISLSSMFSVGISGFLFAIIGRFAQQKLGKIVGIQPGSDMKIAIKCARKNKATLMLIDRNIAITLKRFSKEFKFKEKFSMLKEFISAFFKKKKDLIKFDLRKVPSEKVINGLLKEVKKKYPGIYKVLVEERNYFMANNLIKIANNNPEKKILAVVGAGHIEGMKDILLNYFDKNPLPKTELNNNSISFSYTA